MTTSPSKLTWDAVVYGPEAQENTWWMRWRVPMGREVTPKRAWGYSGQSNVKKAGGWRALIFHDRDFNFYISWGRDKPTLRVGDRDSVLIVFKMLGSKSATVGKPKYQRQLGADKLRKVRI